MLCGDRRTPTNPPSQLHTRLLCTRSPQSSINAEGEVQSPAVCAQKCIMFQWDASSSWEPIFRQRI